VKCRHAQRIYSLLIVISVSLLIFTGWETHGQSPSLSEPYAGSLVFLVGCTWWLVKIGSIGGISTLKVLPWTTSRSVCSEGKFGWSVRWLANFYNEICWEVDVETFLLGKRNRYEFARNQKNHFHKCLFVGYFVTMIPGEFWQIISLCAPGNARLVSAPRKLPLPVSNNLLVLLIVTYFFFWFIKLCYALPFCLLWTWVSFNSSRSQGSVSLVAKVCVRTLVAHETGAYLQFP